MQSNDWQALQQKSRADAIEKIAATTRIDEIRSTILKSFQMLSDQTFDAYNATPAIEYIARQLRHCGVDEWADAFIGSCNPPTGVKPPHLAAVDIVVGQVAGMFCGLHPGEKEFTFVRHIHHTIRYSSRDFLKFAQPLVEKNDSAKSALLAMLRGRIADYQSQPERLIAIAARDMEALQKRTTEGDRFADVWKEPYRRPHVFIHDPVAYELLRRVDRQRYLMLLDALPINDLGYHLLNEANGSASVADLCTLLRDALPVFDDDGHWKKGKYIAFYILNHLNGRLFAEIEDDGSLNDRFESCLVQVLSSLNSRADYIPLAYAWMQHLLLFGQRRRRLSDILNVNTTKALVRISTAIAVSLPPLRNPIQWIAEEQDVWRSGRVYALLAIELGRTDVDDRFLAEIIEQVILQGLILPVGMERLRERPDVFEWCVMSSAISRIPHVSAWFEQLWVKMYWRRSQARGHRRSGVDRVNGPEVIIWWSIAGLAGLKPASGEARTLWMTLEAASRESYFTDAYHVYDSLWLLILRFLGAFWSVTFPDDPARGEPGSLDDFLSRWSAVTREFALLTVTLQRHGVSPTRLAAAGITAELLSLIVEDSKVLDRSLLSVEDVKLINDLANEILTCKS